MRILLLGSTGQVGGELAKVLPSLGSLVSTSRSGNTDHVLDLNDTNKLQSMLDVVSPDIIINASAYTAVDKAESEPDLAMKLNSDVPAVIGAWAAANEALVVHYSTDYVYDGTKDGPYQEIDEPNPTNVYGRTKLAGDESLLASGCVALILRVSWVYGLHGRNFLLTMQRLMQEREELSIVNDQIGSPTWSRSIAAATVSVLSKTPNALEDCRQLKGIYHLSPQGSTSWFGFASAIQDKLGLTSCKLSPISTDQYPTPAKRPTNSQLDPTKLKNVFGVTVPKWDQELNRCLTDLNVSHSGPGG